MQSVIHLKQGTFDLFPPVYAVQNDTGRTLKMIVDDVTYSNTDTGNLYFRRSDGSYYNVSTTFDSTDNSFEADISQALTQPGITQCQLKVSDTNDIVVSTYTFVIVVQESADGVPQQQLGVSVQELIEAAQQLTLSDNDVKLALLQIAEKVVYVDEHGQDYYDALEDALYPPIRATGVTLNKNSLVFSGIGGTDTLVATVSPNNVEDDTVYWGSSDKDVAVVSDGVVTAVGFGSCTITATCNTKHASASVSIAQATLLSISAAYTQSGAVYTTTPLDDLKDDLVVTAYWDDNTQSTVPAADYTLSGTLTSGTSTITVTYSGKTDTFQVTVTALYVFHDWLKGDGTAFIDTGLSNQTYGADAYEKYVEFIWGGSTGAYQKVFGARNSWGTTGFYVGSNNNSNPSGTQLCSCANSATHSGVAKTVAAEISLKDKKRYIDGELVYTGTSDTTTITKTSNICLFAEVSGATGTGFIAYGSAYVGAFAAAKVYEFAVKDSNDNYVARMLPAVRTSDSAVGMYDTIRDQFFVNTRDTGSFTIGDD